MSRSYRSVRPKANRVYSVDEVFDLYAICPNTLGNWIKGGLRPVDDLRPRLFRGAELARFHRERADNAKRPLRTGEFRCFTCQEAVIPEPETIYISARTEKAIWLFATCPVCGAAVNRIQNATACDSGRNGMQPNTAPDVGDEENGALRGGVVRNRGQACQTWTPENERSIRDYQIYAGRFDTRTLDAHLAAIRDFEDGLGGKPFGSVRPEDVARYRTNLIERGRAGEIGKSTVQHRASHLKAFFNWLVLQDGYRRMNKTIGGYFELPRSEVARTVQPKPRGFPTVEEVHLILSSMPDRTLIERRDRAIIAASFLFGTRAGATASLRLIHVDVGARKVYQDATVVRVKNSKSQTTLWFPIGEPAEGIVRSWVDELGQLGCMPADALFPPDEVLETTRLVSKQDRNPIEPWQSENSIRRAFRRGCEGAGLPYFNPHSARHFLKSIRDDHCRTAEQRKAWSYNMGHENEQITETNYARMTDERRDQLFESLSAGDNEPIEDLQLLLAYHEHQLVPGTPEFERAEQLSETRRRRRSEKKTI